MADDGSEYRRLKRTLEELFAGQRDDGRLRDHLEGLLRDEFFPGLTWYWGPILYERNRATFRPVILNHFSDWAIAKSGRWRRVAWADHAERLDRWLGLARANRDTRLVRQLLAWKYAGKGWEIDAKRWNQALIGEFAAAPTPAARTIVLDEFDIWFQIDERTAVWLYEIDRSAADFILKHLPSTFWGGARKREMWIELGDLARARGDEKLFFALYRKLMPVNRWAEEVLFLAGSISDPAELNTELNRRHLDGYDLKLGGTVVTLLQRHGRDVLPYVREKLSVLFGGWGHDSAAKLIELAEAKGWWDLWAAALRINSDRKLYNAAIAALLDDRAISEADRIERLRALAGVSREWNWPGLGLATIHSLNDDLAQRLYARYPELVRGPFLPQVTPRWWEGYPKLLAAAQQAQDAELIDILASRYITRFQYRYYQAKEADAQLETAKALAGYYQAIRERDRAAFARRASNVLTRIPAYVAYDYNQLLRTNDLARLFFVRSFEAYLGVPRAVRDLVEGSNIYVQMLAYRVLAADDDRARALALENVDILLGTLLRPIHRKTRLPAFDALANAARADERAAARVLARAREALRLPDKRYPKPELIGLIARILHAQPTLRDASEIPVVYMHGARAA